jgi:hypothetical protein
VAYELEELNQDSLQRSIQKCIHKVQQMPKMPQPYAMKDWRETARKYDRFVFDFDKKGEFLPLIWWDTTHHNMTQKTFGLMSYVGKYKQGEDGTQESVNLLGK